MTSDVLLAFLLFTFVSSITPGPNNLMMLSSGLRFGFRASLPHLFGVSLGHAFLVFCVAQGLSQVFERLPWLQLVLKVLGGAYLLYLAWKIAISPPPDASGEARDTPLGFLGAALFQWVNPKGWMMALGAIAAYLPPHTSLVGTLGFASVFAAVNLPCVAMWVLFGTRLRQWLNDPLRLRLFNSAMAAGLVLSLWPMLKG